MLPSGQQALFSNRVGWARTYLKQANLIEPTRRGFNQITIRGREVLARKPRHINVDFLDQFEEFRDFRSRRRNRVAGALPNPDGDESTKTPEEILEIAYEKKMRNDLASELLQRLKTCSPSFFFPVNCSWGVKSCSFCCSCAVLVLHSYSLFRRLLFRVVEQTHIT